MNLYPAHQELAVIAVIAEVGFQVIQDIRVVGFQGIRVIQVNLYKVIPGFRVGQAIRVLAGNQYQEFQVIAGIQVIAVNQFKAIQGFQVGQELAGIQAFQEAVFPVGQVFRAIAEAGFRVIAVLVGIQELVIPDIAGFRAIAGIQARLV